MWEKIFAGYFLACVLSSLAWGLHRKDVISGLEVLGCSVLVGVGLTLVAGAVLVLIA